MLIEAITVKLAADFFELLRKNRIHASDIKVSFFDGQIRQYVNFADTADITKFFRTNYLIFDRCEIGDLVRVESFRAVSVLNRFTSTYNIIDVCGSFKIMKGREFDVNRNSVNETFQKRQIEIINKIIASYSTFCVEITGIFNTGIYSPCYAEPGWSEGTGRLEELRKLLINTNRTLSL